LRKPKEAECQKLGHGSERLAQKIAEKSFKTQRMRPQLAESKEALFTPKTRLEQVFRRRPAKEKSRAWFLSSKRQQTKTSVQRTSARAHAGARRTTKARGTREWADPSALSTVGALQLDRKWGSHTSDGRVLPLSTANALHLDEERLQRK
jgi:hypothetical protein